MLKILRALVFPASVAVALAVALLVSKSEKSDATTVTTPGVGIAQIPVANGQFDSVSASTVQTLVPPASNTNGVILWQAIMTAGTGGQVGVCISTSTPSNINGACVLVSASAGMSNPLPYPILLKAGLGLYLVNAATASSSVWISFQIL
jgi:hypothetical protein